jgi:hypothetical protein
LNNLQKTPSSLLKSLMMSHFYFKNMHFHHKSLILSY